MNPIIQSESYCNVPDNLHIEFAELLRHVWPTVTFDSRIHPEEVCARSFYCRIDSRLVAYAAVVGKEIQVGKNNFRFAGLSCVATLPEYRHLGLGTKIVCVATTWMEQQDKLDFGIFTCQPSLADFYRQAGNWEIAPRTVLISNSAPDALSSKALDVVVLMRLFSAKAKKHEEELQNGTINLNFPPGEFL